MNLTANPLQCLCLLIQTILAEYNPIMVVHLAEMCTIPRAAMLLVNTYTSTILQETAAMEDPAQVKIHAFVAHTLVSACPNRTQLQDSARARITWATMDARNFLTTMSTWKTVATFA